MKIQKQWQQYTNEIYRRDAEVTDFFEEEPFDEEPAVVENEMKAVLKAKERN